MSCLDERGEKRRVRIRDAFSFAVAVALQSKTGCEVAIEIRTSAHLKKSSQLLLLRSERRRERLVFSSVEL